MRKCCIVLLLSFLAHSSHSFSPLASKANAVARWAAKGGEEETFYVKNNDDRLDAGLSPPPINIRKESILFGENPATMDNNNALRLWVNLKGTLPFVFTGAREPDTGDDNPIGAIYNIIFVRVPVIVAGLVYGKNQIEGHPLVVDFGDGPLAMNPLVVLGVMFFILR